MLQEKDECAQWKGVTKLILDKCRLLLDQQEEDRVTNIMFSMMDALDPNFTCHTLRLFKPADLELLMQFGVLLADSDALSLSIREMGLNLLETLVTNRRKFFRTKGHLKTVIDATYRFACLDKPEDCETVPHEYGMGILDSISNSANPDQVFKICTANCQELFNSELPARRLVGYYSIGVISEGCQEQARMHLVDILNQMTRGFEDPNVDVRVKTFTSLG